MNQNQNQGPPPNQQYGQYNANRTRYNQPQVQFQRQPQYGNVPQRPNYQRGQQQGNNQQNVPPPWARNQINMMIGMNNVPDWESEEIHAVLSDENELNSPKICMGDMIVGDSNLLRIETVMDTGSSISLMRKDIFQKVTGNLRDNTFIADRIKAVKVPNGGIMKLNVYAYVPIQMPKGSLQAKVWIVDSFPHKMLLGQDFLSMHRFVIDYDLGTISRPIDDLYAVLNANCTHGKNFRISFIVNRVLILSFNCK